MNYELERLKIKANNFFEKAHNIKEKVRKNDENIKLYLNASGNYFKAGKVSGKILKKKLNVNEKIEVMALMNYYFYESCETKYAFLYKNNKFKESLKIANRAKLFINRAISIIDNNIDNIDNIEIKTSLKKMRDYWYPNKTTAEIYKIQVIAKEAMLKKDFILALDSYKEIGKLQERVYSYIMSSTLKQAYKRIAEGNYYGSKANIATSLAGIYEEQRNKSLNLGVTKDILEQFLISYESIKDAWSVNPENIKYKEGNEVTKDNITLLLKNNKEQWEDYYLEFKKYKIISSLMNKIDSKIYNDLTINEKSIVIKNVNTQINIANDNAVIEATQNNYNEKS